MRIVIEIKPGSGEAVMAYLFKHTRLEESFAYNATCLVPDEHGVLGPKRCGVVEILKYFLAFDLRRSGGGLSFCWLSSKSGFTSSRASRLFSMVWIRL